MERQLLNKALRALETILVLLVVGYIGWLIYQRWIEVRDVHLSFQWMPFLLGCVSLAVFDLVYVACWRFTLRQLDRKAWLPRYLDLNRIFFLSFLTRYLPAGSVLNLGGRVELFKRLGGRRSKALQSVYYEQLSMISSVVVLSAIGLHFYEIAGVPAILARNRDVAALIVAGSALTGFFIADLVVLRAPSWLHLDRIKSIWVPLPFGRKAGLFGLFTLVNLAQGVAAYWMVRAVYPSLGDGAEMVYLVAAAYLAGRLTGQLAAPIPGGIGIREGAFTFFLSTYIPVRATIVGGSLFRLVSIVLEAVLAIAFVLASRITPGTAGHVIPREDQGEGVDLSDRVSEAANDD